MCWYCSIRIRDACWCTTPAGKQLADLKVAPDKTLLSGGVQLTNRSGDVRLERCA